MRGQEEGLRELPETITRKGLYDSVRRLTPAELTNKEAGEKGEHILDTFLNGLDLIAMTILEEWWDSTASAR